MKYTCNEAGIAALKKASGALDGVIESVDGAVDSLNGTSASYDGILGPHKASLDAALERISALLAMLSDDVENVSESLSDVAEAYEDVLENDRIRKLVSGGGSSNIRSGLASAAVGVAGSGASGVCGQEAGGAGGSSTGSVSGMGGVNDMVPKDGASPRQLEKTAFGYTEKNGAMIFDSPHEMGGYLYRTQGDAYRNYQGTCGLCSVVNVLRLAGVNATEKEIIDYAVKHNLCENGLLSSRNSKGGTTPENIRDLLTHFGVSCSTVPTTSPNSMVRTISSNAIDTLVSSVEQGKGVVVAVKANEYDPSRYDSNGLHAVTVVSVSRDKLSGQILDVYVCDSNSGNDYGADTVDRIPAGEFFGAMAPIDMIITDKPIR